MLAIKTILVPTDFSEHADLAFRLACSLARDTGGRVIAMHVTAPLMMLYAGSLLPPLPEDRGEWRRKLEALQPPTRDVAVEHRIVEGDPVTEILRIAREANCDLILVGTHGRTGLGRFLLGSVAEQVVRRAPCPVLTVRKQVEAKVENVAADLATADSVNAAIQVGAAHEAALRH